ncbi:hypothetical protein BH23CHL8_BH23CHL8_23080 [soil metagenome]
MVAPALRVPDRSAMTEAVRVVCFPHEDHAFVVRVRQLVIAPIALGEPGLAVVEALLRESYPLAVVSQRHPLAALDRGRVWYVFRDGSIAPRPEGQAG